MRGDLRIADESSSRSAVSPVRMGCPRYAAVTTRCASCVHHIAGVGMREDLSDGAAGGERMQALSEQIRTPAMERGELESS